LGGSLDRKMKTMDKKIKIGVIGCGNISGIYFEQAKTFDILEVAACADLVMERAREKAAKHGVPRACSVDELLADPEIQIVVNLTTPGSHAQVALASLQAGKSVYNEKPLTIKREDAQQIIKFERIVSDQALHRAEMEED